MEELFNKELLDFLKKIVKKKIQIYLNGLIKDYIVPKYQKKMNLTRRKKIVEVGQMRKKKL